MNLLTADILYFLNDNKLIYDIIETNSDKTMLEISTIIPNSVLKWEFIMLIYQDYVICKFGLSGANSPTILYRGERIGGILTNWMLSLGRNRKIRKTHIWKNKVLGYIDLMKDEQLMDDAYVRSCFLS